QPSRPSSSGEDTGPSSLGRGFESRWTHQSSDGWPSGLRHRGANAEDASVPQVRILLHPPDFVAHSSVAERPAYTRPAAVRFRLRRPFFGEVAERFKAPVPKTGGPQGSVGSNPTLSASTAAVVELADTAASEAAALRAQLQVRLLPAAPVQVLRS